VKIDCPHCHKALALPDHIKATRLRCPHCRKAFSPAAPSPSPADPQSAAATCQIDALTGPADPTGRPSPPSIPTWRRHASGPHGIFTEGLIILIAVLGVAVTLLAFLNESSDAATGIAFLLCWILLAAAVLICLARDILKGIHAIYEIIEKIPPSDQNSS